MKKGQRFGVHGCDSILTIVKVTGRTAHYVFDHDRSVNPIDPVVYDMDIRGLEKITFAI